MIRFFHQKIFYQVYVSIVILTGIMMFVGGYLVLQEQERSILEVMRTQAQTVAKSIELVSADAMVTDDQSFLVEHNLNVLDHTPSIRFIFISKNHGEGLLTQQGKWNLMPDSPADVKPLETNAESQLIRPDPFSDHKERVYYYIYPLNFDGVQWGWIHIGFSLESLEHSYTIMYRKMGLIFSVVFLMISIITYFMIRRIINPIVALSHATKKMTQGDFRVQIQSDRTDEVGELTRNFNIMAKALAHSQNELIKSNLFLEQKVEERTRELEEINRTLDERVRREIMQRREQEQILIQQSRFAAMGEMIGNIAHQWRQPLNALSLLLQNIINAYETNRLDQTFIQRVNEKGMLLTSTMSTTIDDFRNFFKPNRSKELFDIALQTDRTLQMLQASFHDHLIDVQTDVGTGLKIYGFPNEFSQVLLNILNNAKDALIEHRPHQRLIRINGYRTGPNIHLEVCDNAGGIDPAVIDKIFDPYFTTKDEGKGTGIGLYMSKVIIENNMQGKLYARNNDDGACFILVMDAAAEGDVR